MKVGEIVFCYSSCPLHIQYIYSWKIGLNISLHHTINMAWFKNSLRYEITYAAMATVRFGGSCFDAVALSDGGSGGEIAAGAMLLGVTLRLEGFMDQEPMFIFQKS